VCEIGRVEGLVLILRGGDEGRRVDDEDLLGVVSLIGIRFVGDDGGGRIRSRDCLRGR
jgi:hypothetical protein